MARRRITAGLGVAGMAAALVLSAAPASAVTVGTTEGCTPGYWKNHPEQWEEYKPGDLLTGASVGFVFPAELASFRDVTMLEALQGGGGPGLTGATRVLLRAATAAYLNAAHEGVEYPLRRFSETYLKGQVNRVLASLDRQRILDLAATLDEANNLGCPLN